MLTFKQEVVLALLQDTSWMPTFSEPEDMAEYLSEEPPKTTSEAIALAKMAMAVLLEEFSEQIVKTVGE